MQQNSPAFAAVKGSNLQVAGSFCSRSSCIDPSRSFDHAACAGARCRKSRSPLPSKMSEGMCCSVHFLVFFPANYFSSSSRLAIQTDVWKVQNTNGRFVAQLHPSNFLLKILFLVPKVSNSSIFQKRCFMKII